MYLGHDIFEVNKCFWPQLWSVEVPILCQRLEDFTEHALTHGFVTVCRCCVF